MMVEAPSGAIGPRPAVERDEDMLSVGMSLMPEFGGLEGRVQACKGNSAPMADRFFPALPLNPRESAGVAGRLHEGNSGP